MTVQISHPCNSHDSWFGFLATTNGTRENLDLCFSIIILPPSFCHDFGKVRKVCPRWTAACGTMSE